MSLIDKLQPQKPDAKSSYYVIHCMDITIIIMLGIWILNITGVFPLNKEITFYCMITSLIVYVAGMICWFILGINRRRMKYFVILWTVILTTIMATGLTFHAILATILPILFCSLYSSKRLMIYTYVLTVIITFIVVFAGYHIGICDANMTLLPGEALSVYLDENGTFIHTDVNDNLLYNLTLFFVFPRCIIYSVCMIVSYNISKILLSNAEHAKHMEVLAEIDGMTGLYNKTKFLNISKELDDISQVSVIFWDVNNLKLINDTNGHEAGDMLIRTVANNIRILANDNKMAFRMGGDEFIMILKDANEFEAVKTAEQWKKNINSIKGDYPFEISASIGYSSGHGKNLQDIIKAADKMMYTQKRNITLVLKQTNKIKKEA